MQLLTSFLGVFHSSFIPQFLVLTTASLLLALLDPSLCILSHWGGVQLVLEAALPSLSSGAPLLPPSTWWVAALSRSKLSLEWFPQQLGLLPAPFLQTGVTALAQDHSPAAEVPLSLARGQVVIAHWSLCKHTWALRRLYPISSNCSFYREANQIRYISMMTAVSIWVLCLWQNMDKPAFSTEIACYDYISSPVLGISLSI